DLAYAFLDGRYELAGYRAADDRVHELESRAAGQRLDPQEHLAELAGAAGLLLVAVVTFRVARDRLAVGDLRRPRFQLDAELVLDALEHEPQVELAHAAQHRLVRLRRVLDQEARLLRRLVGQL